MSSSIDTSASASAVGLLVSRALRPLVRSPFTLLALGEGGVCTFAWLHATAVAVTPGSSLLALLFTVLVLLAEMTVGLYAPRQRIRFRGVLLRLLVAVSGASAPLLLAAILIPALRLSIATVSLAALLSLSSLTLVRLLFEQLTDRTLFRRRVLVLGTGRAAEPIAHLRERVDGRGFQVHGYAFFSGESLSDSISPVVHPGTDLVSYCEAHDIEEVVVALDDPQRTLPFQSLLDARFAGLPIIRVVDFLERETGKIPLDVVHPSWLIFSDGFAQTLWSRAAQRAFDLAASLFLVVCVSPFMLLAALTIKLTEGLKAPVFYSQWRVGRQGTLFRVMKFRSMRVDAEKAGAQWATKRDPRVTRFGAFMRKTRIDELPQILNVLRGDMSFVGPRPERPEFVGQLEQKIPYYRERHAVKPGLAGWAQLCYPYGACERDALEKLQYDLYYIKNRSVLFDALILLQTVELVLWGKGQ